MRRSSDCEPVSLVGIEQAKAKLEKKKSETFTLIGLVAIVCFIALIVTIKL